MDKNKGGPQRLNLSGRVFGKWTVKEKMPSDNIRISGLTSKKLSQLYNVGITTIQKIKNNTIWVR